MNSISRFFHFIWKRIKDNPDAHKQAWGCVFSFITVLSSFMCSFISTHISNNFSMEMTLVSSFMGFVTSVLTIGIVLVILDMTSDLRREISAAWKDATHKE